jgi:hypothetical protein
MHKTNLVGLKFNRWLVLGLAAPLSKGSATCYWCQCDCGTQRAVRGNDLTQNRSKSCGCWNMENLQAMHRTHGMSTSPEYRIWCAMIDRCYRPKAKEFERYGGRGISVCDKWRHNFSAFLADMGLRPHAKMQLDRRSNDGNYTPENCRWVTVIQQQNNSNSNHKVAFNGQIHTIAEWSRILGLEYGTLCSRFCRHWSVERALTTPLRLP